MSLTSTTLRRPSRSQAGLAVGATVLAALLVGCGSDDTVTDSSAAQPDPAAQGRQNGRGGPGQGGMPGTFGLIAAIDGDVLQVQNQMTGQVAVTVGADATLTDQAAASLAEVTAGVCVVVRSADSATSGSDAASTEIAAASVAITPAADDGCAGGFGSRGGDSGPGGGGQRPTDFPPDLPDDMPSRPEGSRPGGFGAFGEVTSVSARGFVVEGMDVEITVTVSGDTTYTQQVAADEDALEVGRCVQVEGEADDTGAVTATSIAVSDAVDDTCAR